MQAGPVRYVLLNDSPDLKHFMHPLALNKLAHFLVDTLIVRVVSVSDCSHSIIDSIPPQEMGMAKKIKPFIVGALREATGNFVIIGLPGTHSGAASKPKYSPPSH